MTDATIPADLSEFFRSGRALDYEAARAEPGAVTLHHDPPTVNLAVDSDGAGWRGIDPHAGEKGYYAVAAVDLVEECDGFDPLGVLVWVPAERCFGTWDPDHWDLTVFPGATWADIVADPIPYINAQWTGDVGELLVPIGRYAFVLGDYR